MIYAPFCYRGKTDDRLDWLTSRRSIIAPGSKYIFCLMSMSDCAIFWWRPFASMLVVVRELARCRTTLHSLTAFIIIIIVVVVTYGGGAQLQQVATGGRGQGGAREDSSSSSHDAAASAPHDKAANSTLLYECEISYVQMDMSLIRFSINYLELARSGNWTNGKLERVPSRFTLPAINYESQPSQLRALTKLNASQPFVFFINGFNTFGPTDEINATWMYDVAKSFASRPGLEASPSGNPDAEQWDTTPRTSPGPGPRNVIFLTWSIPNLFASNLLSMIPAYYKTVANYDLIMDCVTRTLAKLIAFVDSTRHFETPDSRLDYFRSWHFYGHSLGSHILSDAISRVVVVVGQSVPNFVTLINSTTTTTTTAATGGQFELRPLKFGKLVGLDPATPCFVSREYGISSAKVARAVQEVLVLHSNAGFAGVPNERANLEIVLNGGTFQPGCSWYDFTCHHVRSTDILSYLDDQCQMVAYKCTSYQHFKLGACETCYGPPSALLTAAAAAKLTPARYERLARNCVLVNLPEQHQDSRAVLEYADQLDDELRQLAELDVATAAAAAAAATGARAPRTATIELFRRLDELERREREREREQVVAADKSTSTTTSDNLTLTGSFDSGATSKARKSYYHFVSTSPNFRFGRQTHCLQHYQLRLLIYYAGSKNLTKSLQDKCKLSSYYVSSNDEIKLKMYYESGPYEEEAERVAGGGGGGDGSLTGNKTPKLVLDNTDPRQMSSSIKLSGIIKDLFHTTLVNFEGPPRLFTGAQLINIDWLSLSECLLREGATGASGPNFVLDVAFMSHTNHKIRHAFSSVLCGQLDPRQMAKGNNGTSETSELAEELTLRLCKRSDLADVSAQIDKLLDHMRLHRLDETWKVSLLNNLFSLFTEWEPF